MSDAPRPDEPALRPTGRQPGRHWYRLALWLWVIASIAPLPWLMGVLPSRWWLPFSLWLGLTRLLWLGIVPDWLLGKAAKREPLPPGALHERVTALCPGAARPAIYRLTSPAGPGRAEAYFIGLGRRQQILLSAALLDTCAAETVVAVTSHELAHWRQGDIWRQWLAFCLAAVAITAVAAQVGDDWGWGLAVKILATVGAALAYAAYGRALEYRADALAVAQLGSPWSYGRALEEIGRHNGEPPESPRGAAAWLHTHPSRRKRLQRLGLGD